MTFSKPVLVTFSLIAFAAASAYAADADKQRTRAGAALSQDAGTPSFSGLDRNNDGMLSRAEYEAGAGASGGATRGAKMSAGEAHASKIIGMNVSNAQGEDLGEIKDIVVDLQGGRVHAAVLEFGGFLGMGEKHYAFPISQLKPGKDRDKLMLNVDEEKLKNAEGFAKDQYPAMSDEYWGRVQGQRQAASGASQGQGPDQQARKAHKANLVRASELMGKEVRNQAGKEIGEVQDLIVSLNDGRIRNVVLDLDDGGQTRIQPKALSAGMGDKLVVNMSSEQLRSQSKNQQSR